MTSLPCATLVFSLGCASKPAPPPPGQEPMLTVSAPTEPVVPRITAPTEPVALPSSVVSTRVDWSFASNPGVLIETDHYRIHTTIGYERILERLPIFMECAMARYTSTLAALPAPSDPVNTYIFRDRRQWTAKTRQLLPEQAGTFQNLGRGGYTTRGVSVLYYIDWRGRDRDTFAISAHEGWHQFTQSTFRHPLPVWLEEGIATYMEGYRFRHGQPHPEFNPARNWERGRALGDALRRDRLIPLAELLGNTPQDFLSEGKNRLLTYYAQVWALTRFLADGDDGRYRDALAEALTDAAEGRLAQRLMRSPSVIAYGGRYEAATSRSGPWLILAYFTNDLAAFEEEFLEYARMISR